VSNWRWLASTRQLQEDSFGVEYPLTGDQLADYVTFNAAALTAELGEFLQEIGWKTWATGRGWVNRDQAVGELVDAAHFLANLACALGVTDEEWETRYTRKQGINADRQATGYDGVSGKCQCGRAVEDGKPFQDEITLVYLCPCGRTNLP
jgi:hypothetical protein